jgi:hypothetical protein
MVLKIVEVGRVDALKRIALDRGAAYALLSEAHPLGFGFARYLGNREHEQQKRDEKQYDRQYDLKK